MCTLSSRSTSPTHIKATATAEPAVSKPERLTYSVDETAAALGVSVPTIYRLINRGILKPVRFIRHKRIPCQQLRALVAGKDVPGLN